MITFDLFQMRVREPFYLMYGFCHEWGGYEMTDDQKRLMHRFSESGRDRDDFYKLGIDLARGIRAGTKRVPDWLKIKEEATC